MYKIGEKELQALREVFESGHLFRYKDGKVAPATAKFEKQLAGHIGVKHALAVSSGTAALISALAGMGIGPGDEVIVPSYTFISTALAPLAVGAVPIIAEVDETLTIDPVTLEDRISPYTRAVVPVHMLGLPCNLDAIQKVAKKHDVMVLEDAAQAAGGSYHGKRFGSIGHAGILSFNHYKIIAAGEGGAILTDNQEIYQRSMIYHDGGCVFFDNDAADNVSEFFCGNNYRASEVTSAIMNIQLERLDGILERLRERKNAMNEVFASADSGNFQPSPCNEPAGDCASNTPIIFDSADAAKAFVEKHSGKVGMFRPIDSPRHTYPTWDPILNKKPHHPKMDPWKWARREIEYSKDMCPQSLDVMARSVTIATPFDRSLDETKELARELAK